MHLSKEVGVGFFTMKRMKGMKNNMGFQVSLIDNSQAAPEQGIARRGQGVVQHLGGRSSLGGQTVELLAKQVADVIVMTLKSG